VQDREAEEWKSERKGGRVAKTGLFMLEPWRALKGGYYVTAYWGSQPKRARLNSKEAIHRSAIYNHDLRPGDQELL
jgi:hypothetical protein